MELHRKQRLGLGERRPLAVGEWPHESGNEHGLLLARRGTGRRSGVADGGAIDHKLHAAIALAALGSVVRSDRLRFAEAACGDGRSGHALLGQEITHGIGAAFGELLIEVIATDAVGVALDL